VSGDQKVQYILEVNKMRIIVIPERLDDFSRQMSQAANELRDLEGRLGRALGGLDWQVRQQANVEGQVHAARRQALALADEAGRLARFLTDRAAAFRQADAEGAQSLGDAVRPYITPPTPVPVPTPEPGEVSSQPLPLPSSDSPARSELERLLNTLLAFQPILVEWLLKKLGLSDIKHILELIQVQKYMEEMDQAREAWLEAELRYGKDSPQAAEAREKYYDTYGNVPIIGPFIKAALDMGRANPVE
jgi:hypothetical protein